MRSVSRRNLQNRSAGNLSASFSGLKFDVNNLSVEYFWIKNYDGYRWEEFSSSNGWYVDRYVVLLAGRERSRIIMSVLRGISSDDELEVSFYVGGNFLYQELRRVVLELEVSLEFEGRR